MFVIPVTQLVFEKTSTFLGFENFFFYSEIDQN